jgi:hypothetical protein
MTMNEDQLIESLRTQKVEQLGFGATPDGENGSTQLKQVNVDVISLQYILTAQGRIATLI